jgi:hypothetical protein
MLNEKNKSSYPLLPEPLGLALVTGSNMQKKTLKI